jgi:hypothetical protein
VRTRVRGVALLLLGATAAVYAGLALPLQKKAAAAADAYRGARDERRTAYARLGEIRRRESALRRAAPSGGAGAALSRDPVGQTRQGIVASLEGAALTDVRLAVRPGSPPAAAQVNVSAEGPFAEVVRLTGELVRPGSGVVLERFQLTGRDSRVAMRLEGVGLEAAR